MSSTSSSRSDINVLICVASVSIGASLITLYFDRIIIPKIWKINTQLCPLCRVIVVTRKGTNMWLDKLKELKKETGMSLNQIADMTGLPDKTIDRIFSGKTTNPYVSTLYPIVTVLGSSLNELFADTKVVVGNEKLATLQKTVDEVTAELNVANAEIAVLKDKIAALTAENDLLRIKLELKEEMLAIHNYYIRRKDNE